MYTVIWIWNDGTMGQYKVDTKRDAIMMATLLGQNSLIQTVNISDM